MKAQITSKLGGKKMKKSRKWMSLVTWLNYYVYQATPYRLDEIC